MSNPVNDRKQSAPTGANYETLDSAALAARNSHHAWFRPGQREYVIQHLRKGRTFFFNTLTADGFDTVLNPVVIEPVVQFTLYLKVKYDIEARPDKK